MKFKPMLAVECSEHLDSLSFPLLASPKLDGIRCVIKDGAALSRSLKPIPNLAIQEALGQHFLNGLDGELIVGNPTDTDVYRNTNSQVMSVNGGCKGVTFYTFDRFTEPDRFYNTRRDKSNPIDIRGVWVTPLEQKRVMSLQELEQYETEVLERGYEGIMLRSSTAPYKFGRSTLKQQALLKLKRFSHDEAEIIGIEEEMANLNEATTNALGHTERSSHAAGKVGKGRLGAVVVRDLKTGIEFNIGSGFTAQEREELWQQDLMGRIVRYKHFLIGVKDKPRFPTFDGFRSKEDL